MSSEDVEPRGTVQALLCDLTWETVLPKHVEDHLINFYSADELALLCRTLARPPAATCVRTNTVTAGYLVALPSNVRLTAASHAAKNNAGRVGPAAGTRAQVWDWVKMLALHRHTTFEGTHTWTREGWSVSEHPAVEDAVLVLPADQGETVPFHVCLDEQKVVVVVVVVGRRYLCIAASVAN